MNPDVYAHGWDNREYTDEERVFLLAVERYRRERRRPFPTCREVLAIALALGYRKVAPAEELPR